MSNQKIPFDPTAPWYEYHRLVAVSKDPKQSKGVDPEWASLGDGSFGFIPTMNIKNPHNGQPSEFDQLMAMLSQETGWDEDRVRREFTESFQPVPELEAALGRLQARGLLQSSPLLNR